MIKTEDANAAKVEQERLAAEKAALHEELEEERRSLEQLRLQTTKAAEDAEDAVRAKAEEVMRASEEARRLAIDEEVEGEDVLKDADVERLRRGHRLRPALEGELRGALEP